jgi:hypothetical protein
MTNLLSSRRKLSSSKFLAPSRTSDRVIKSRKKPISESSRPKLNLLLPSQLSKRKRPQSLSRITSPTQYRLLKNAGRLQSRRIRTRSSKFSRASQNQSQKRLSTLSKQDRPSTKNLIHQS